MKRHVFRKQVGNRGCYAEILFDVRLIEEPKGTLTVNYVADEKWELACRTGVLLFFDYLNRKTSASLEVTIHEIKWLPIDTNNLLVLYACIEGLKDALNIPIANLKFDAKDEIFIFPEVRSVGNG